MVKFLLYIISFVGSVFLFSMAINYGLKLAANWDHKISNKLNRSFQGFNWYFRIPFSTGVIPEYFFYLVLRAENYFKTNWWALKLFAFNTFLIFIAVLSNNAVVTKYYSYSYYAENGINALFTSGITFWYLNLLTLFFLAIITLIIIESIRMHAWYAPVRIILYSMLSFFMAVVTLMVLSLIIMITVLYIAYKIIKFLFFSSNRRRQDNDEDVSETLNNNYRVFRAELYEWENSYKTSIRTTKRERKKPTIKRKRPKIERKPKPKPKPKPTSGNDDIPRFYPD